MDKDKSARSFTEEIEVAGSELVEKVKELIKKGNARKLIIRKENGEVLMEIPLSAGVLVGGAATLIAPLLVALGAMAALLSHVRIEVIRKEES